MTKTYINIQTQEILDMEIVYKLEENKMLKNRPELFMEWDFEKNSEIGLDIYEVAVKSNKKAYWLCNENSEHSWHTTISHRARGNNCPNCSGRTFHPSNSLATIHPDIAKEWHPTKNGNLTPELVTRSSNEYAWWICDKGHEWNVKVNNRTSGYNCPYCANQKVWVGFNDMWTTNPELASQLLNSEDGYKYMQSVSKKVDWKCLDCDNIIKNKFISNVNKRRLYCKSCADNIPYGEKMMYHILMEADIDFLYDKRLNWSDNKRYDFYLPNYKTIIEIHGKQHSDKECLFNTSEDGGRDFEEEIENDKYKENIAKENGIENYIVIDSRLTEFKYIKRNIEVSLLSELIPDIKFDKIKILADTTLVKHICNLYEKDKLSISDIERVTKLGKIRITSYLKKGVKLGWCSYVKKKEKASIVQLTLDGGFIKEWNSIAEATNSLGLSVGSISKTCQGKQLTSGGFKWMYKDEYDKQQELLKQNSI